MKRSIEYHTDIDYSDVCVPKVEIIRLLDEVKGDFISCARRMHSETSLFDFLVRVRNAVTAACGGAARMECISSRGLMVRGPGLLVTIEPRTANRDVLDIWESRPRDVDVKAHGALDACRKFDDKFLKPLSVVMRPKLAWHYMSNGRPDSTDLDMENPRPLLPEFYPWFADGPDAWMKEFLASSHGLCVLRGDPGTGKTSFIHSLLWRAGTKAMVTYETAMFKSDELFVEFMTSEDTDIMVMEDADVLLAPRERDGNDAMNRFLNVSAGLVRLPRKKLIISTNIVSDSNIDSALLRRGRCFDSPLFRNLTCSEAKAAARAAGLEADIQDREYSLAELFSISRGEPAPEAKMKMGFAV